MTIKTFNIIKWVLFPIFFCWCILQNIAGFLVFLYSVIFYHQAKRVVSEDGIVYFEVSNVNPCYGVSLGYWIFLKPIYADNITIHHEWGHQIQSLILGPLYLFIVGIPSACANLFKCYNECDYYNLYQEHWADKCGHVLHLYTDPQSPKWYKRVVQLESTKKMVYG